MPVLQDRPPSLRLSTVDLLLAVGAAALAALAFPGLVSAPLERLAPWVGTALIGLWLSLRLLPTAPRG